MTFNQWCARYSFTPHARIPLEAIWNALIGGGNTPPQAGHLLDEMLDAFREKRS